MLPVFAVAAAAAGPFPNPTRLSFEPAPGGAFLARSPRYQVTLMRDGVSLSGPGMGVAVHFAGSKPGNLDGLDREAGVVNYLLGPDPAHWRRNVPTFARFRRLHIYPGIDAVFYGSHGELEYDLIAAPGADASKIVLEFTGAHNLRLNDHGEIALETAGGTLIQQLPSVYQDAPRGRIQLHTRYRVINASAVALIVPSYDHRLPLTIDPALVYSAQIGGHTGNQVNGMTVDSAGNTYLTGSTSAVDFPVVNALESQLAAGSFYRFDNGGASTVRLDSTNAALYTLTADPTNPGTVYAGTLNGILKSTDAGAHWTAGAGLPSGVLSEPIVIDPSNTQVLYTSSYGIYQSL